VTLMIGDSMSDDKVNPRIADPKSYKSDDIIEKRTGKIDLDRIIKELLAEMYEIDTSALSQSAKTTKHRRLASKTINAIYGKRKQKSQNALSLDGASRALTRIRNQISATGVKHHNYDKSLELLKKKHPTCAYLLSTMEGKTGAETRVAWKKVRDKLKDTIRLEKQIDKINPAVNNYATVVNNIAKTFPDWEVEVMALKTVKTTDRKAALEKIHHLFSCVEAFYADLDKLKIDHEIMRHLRKDEFTKRNQESEKTHALMSKKESTISIDYQKTMQVLHILLGPSSSHSWEAIAIGIALATGRRAIEVLMQGEFEKIDKHRLMFSGQAKKREGIENDSFEIYCLTDADVLLDAFKRLRLFPNIVGLQNLETDRFYTLNELVNNRTAGPLNKFMTDLMSNMPITSGETKSTWVYRDTRAIYAKIVFELYFKADKRWKNKDENMFYQELLGHENLDAQKHYMQFKVDNAGGEWEAVEVDSDKRRLEAVKKMSENGWVSGTKARRELHEFVIQQLEEEPWRTFKAVDLRKGRNYKMVKEYMAIMEDALKLDWSIDAILENKAAQVKANQTKTSTTKPEKKTERKLESTEVEALKPKFKPPHQKADGSWDVSFTVNNIEYAETIDKAGDMKEAGKKAWEIWLFKQSLPETPPKPIVTKEKDMWYSRIVLKGQAMCEAWTTSKTASRDASIRMYKDLKQ
ncbi:telomere resolvase, partial [Vibrio sp. S4M6]|uniref:protelomerase family protein n=2 Tax=Vibrio sinus TaxID=2946865 RepID=UPI002029D1D3